MDVRLGLILVPLFLLKCADSGVILCESGFCQTYIREEGCSAPAVECSINNATHRGLWMPSPTTCNCCQFCLPLYGEGAHCSVGGPGLGTTVGRCGHGLSCVANPTDGHSYCQRMDTPCHNAQDDYDSRHAQGTAGALESRPVCDGKGRYSIYECVPTQTCFCQSEEGERIFGEMLNLGAATAMNMHCGCSRLHEKIRKYIEPGLPYPAKGPRCTSEGNFNPVQCMERICHCVSRITGARSGDWSVDLDEEPITKLPCYDESLDLYPELSEGSPPYNYTTPCYERMKQVIEFLQQSEQDGYNVDYFSSVPGCMPDGSFGRIRRGANGTNICVDQHDTQIEEYAAWPNTPQFNDMDCKCAQTTHLMASSPERPVCCRNGNFRTIQCRRGLCRCVDSDGKQYGSESSTPDSLSCFTDNWRDPDSTDCYAK